jgi:hypothetical protein
VNKILAPVFAAAVLAFATIALAAAPAAPVTLPAKNGPVTFDHAKHAGVACKTCHADDKGGKIEGLNKDKGHAMCQECHKKEAKGPQKCAECHKKA